MTIQNPPKAFIALAALVCLTVLMAVGKIEQSAGVGMLGLIVGYAVGNGIAARASEPVQPIIGPKPTVTEQVATLVKAELDEIAGKPKRPSAALQAQLDANAR